MLKEGRQVGEWVTMPTGARAEVVRRLDDDQLRFRYEDGTLADLSEALLDPAYRHRLQLQGRPL